MSLVWTSQSSRLVKNSKLLSWVLYSREAIWRALLAHCCTRSRVCLVAHVHPWQVTQGYRILSLLRVQDGKHRVRRVAFLEICPAVPILQDRGTDSLQILLWRLALLNSALEYVSGIELAEVVIFPSS